MEKEIESNKPFEIESSICPLSSYVPIFYEEYFTFAFSDYELNKIYNNLCSKYSKDHTMHNIEKQFKEYEEYIKNSVNQMDFPYLQHLTENFLRNKFETEEQKKIFLIIVISKKGIVEQHLYNFFYKIIKLNRFGITDKLKQIVTEDVLESKEFNQLCQEIAKWHTNLEFNILYLYMLNVFYGQIINLNKKKFSYEMEIDYNKSVEIFVKKNVFKLCGKMLSGVNLSSPKVDYKKILYLVTASITSGTGIGSLLIASEIKLLAAAAGAWVLNYFIGKVSNKLKDESKLLGIRKLIENTKNYNEKLEQAQVYIFTLLKMDFIQDKDLFLLEEDKREDLKNTSERLITKVSEILNMEEFDNFAEFSEEFEDFQVIQDKLEKQTEGLTCEEIDDQWILMNFK